jgi:hypothetical protein
MKLPFLILLFAVGLAVAGCRSTSGARFYVSRVTPSSAVTVPSTKSDIIAVGEALQKVAAQLNLEDRRRTPGFELTIGYYVKPATNPTVAVLAREIGDVIIVDIEQLHTDRPNAQEYEQVKAAVQAALREKFGHRLKELK